jgi:hypothetical protein
MPLTRAPSPAESRLDEFAELLLACRDAFHRIVDDYRWRYTPSSPAGADLAQLAQSGGRHDIIIEAVSTYLELATHHAAGLAALYMSREIYASPDQLVRSVIEASAKAVWILGFDPAPTARERLACTYLENDLSNEENKKAQEWLHGKTSAAYAAAQQKFTKWRAEMKQLFPGEVDFSKGRTIHQQKQLSPTATVVDFFAIARKRGGTALDPLVAKGIYTVLCNGTHPTLYTLRRKRRPMPLEDGLLGTQLTVDIAEMKKLTERAVCALYVSLATVHNYLGQEFDPDNRLASSIDSVLPGILLPLDR